MTVTADLFSLFVKCFFILLDVLTIFAGVTILLSLTVFLNLVAEKMPTTSDAVPLIGTELWDNTSWRIRGTISPRNVILEYLPQDIL